MRTALIHDWLTGMRGGEKVLETLCALFPEADIYTLLHIPGSVSPLIERHAIRTSFVQKLPFVQKHYRSFLPLFPAAIEAFDLTGYDLIISSSHCAAKGILPPPDAFHLCYCHTPMRYVWDMYPNYFAADKLKGLKKAAIPFFANYLRLWDVSSSSRVDHFAANSVHVQKRILKYYNRQADVVYPPVYTGRSHLAEKHDDFYLIVSAFVPYKRIELAVAAFNKLHEKLLVVGAGPEEKRLKAMAGATISFAGWADADQLEHYYASCRALVFPGEEDFGIVPVEAQCYGKPVIAYGRGGALETVQGHWAETDDEPSVGCSGILFREQTVENIIRAVRVFERWQPQPAAIREHALKFDASVFKTAILELVDKRERL